MSSNTQYEFVDWPTLKHRLGRLLAIMAVLALATVAGGIALEYFQVDRILSYLFGIVVGMGFEGSVVKRLRTW